MSNCLPRAHVAPLFGAGTPPAMALRDLPQRAADISLAELPDFGFALDEAVGARPTTTVGNISPLFEGFLADHGLTRPKVADFPAVQADLAKADREEGAAMAARPAYFSDPGGHGRTDHAVKHLASAIRRLKLRGDHVLTLLQAIRARHDHADYDLYAALKDAEGSIVKLIEVKA